MLIAKMTTIQKVAAMKPGESMTIVCHGDDDFEVIEMDADNEEPRGKHARPNN